MPYTPIVATLGYVLSPDRAHALLIHRNARANDEHLGKFNGLGGKLEPGEDIVTGMRREIREEAGIEPTALSLRGSVNWPGFGKQGEDWLGFIFLITAYTGTPARANAEGELVWVSVDTILRACDDPALLPMWPGDKYFLPLVFGQRPGQFHGVMPYQAGQPTGWHVEWV